MIPQAAHDVGASWLVRGIGWALLNSVWQVATCAASLLLFDLMLARSRPQTRYVLGCLALTMALILPIRSFLQSVRVPQISSSSSPAAGGIPAVIPLERPSMSPLQPVGGSGASEAKRVLTGLAVPLARKLMPWLVGMWALGAAALSARLVGGWWMARNLARGRAVVELSKWGETLRRLATNMRLSSTVRLFECSLVEVPTVVGWMKPAILLPAGMVMGMAPGELEAILAHELAHVRRLDYAVNLIQVWAESLLYFHPAAWWISSRIRAEREHCCDDEAVAACGDAVVYGRALARLEVLRGRTSRLLPAATGGALLQRIRRLAGQPVPVAPRPGIAAVVGLTSLLALLVGTAATTAPVAQRVARSFSAPAGPLASWVGGGRILVALARFPERPGTAGASRLSEAPDRTMPAAREAQAGFQEAALETAAANPPARARRFNDETLVELAQAGISPEVLVGLERAGYGNLDVGEVVSLREAGVSVEYASGMNRVLGRVLSADQLVELREAGVDPAYASEVCAAGRDALDPDALIELRNGGVTADFVAQLRGLGYGSLCASDLAELRSEGITPVYVSGLKALGLESLSAEQLILLRSSEVTVEFLRKLRRAGYEGNSAQELIQLRERGDSIGAVTENSADDL